MSKDELLTAAVALRRTARRLRSERDLGTAMDLERIAQGHEDSAALM